MNTGHGKSYVTVPGAPTSVSASAVTYSSASVSFSAPACTGHTTIDYYQAISSPGCVTATGSSPITVSGLSACTTYTFRVRAHNSAGYGSYSSSSSSITTPTCYVSHSWLVGLAGDTSTFSGSFAGQLSSYGLIVDPNTNGKVVSIGYGICSHPSGYGYLAFASSFNKDSGATAVKKKFGLATGDNRSQNNPSATGCITTNYSYYGNPLSIPTYDSSYYYFSLNGYTKPSNAGKSFGITQTDKSLNYNNARYYSYAPSGSYYDGNGSYDPHMNAGTFIPNNSGSGVSFYGQGSWYNTFTFTYCCCGNPAQGTGFNSNGSPILANFNTSLSVTGAWTYSNLGTVFGRNLTGFTADCSYYYMGASTCTYGNSIPTVVVKASYSNPSSVSWASQLGSGVYTMKADGSGNLYVGTISNSSGYLILVKLDSSGSITWQRQVSVSAGSWASLDLDSNGNIYVASQATYTYTGAIAIYKWNSSGTLQWQRVITGPTYYAAGSYRYGSSSLYLKVYKDTFFLQTDWIINNNLPTATVAADISYVFRLPNDGSRTGSYNITNGGNSYNFNYQSSSFTETSGSLSRSSVSTSGSSVSLTENYHTSGPSVYSGTSNSCISSLVSIY
jgi:hypothetical protein